MLFMLKKSYLKCSFNLLLREEVAHENLRVFYKSQVFLRLLAKISSFVNLQSSLTCYSVFILLPPAIKSD